METKSMKLYYVTLKNLRLIKSCTGESMAKILDRLVELDKVLPLEKVLMADFKKEVRASNLGPPK